MPEKLRVFQEIYPPERKATVPHAVVINDMVLKGGGSILNVASTAGFQPGPNMAVYFATKAFVLSFTEALHEEWKDRNIKVKHPLIEGGPGAIELAARIEKLTFESANKTGTPFTNPRADYLLPNSDLVLTMGVNWTTTRWTRVIVNAIHEDIEDPNRAPNTGTTSYWSGLVRLNIVF